MKKIFNPNTVAVFGATNRKESIGYSVMNNIIGAGYEGVIYPVNLKRNSVFGIKAYKNIKEINDTVDLAVIATPFRTIVDIVKQCGENGVGGIVILSSVRKDIFGGKRVLRKIKRLGEKFGIRIIGPNSLGFISTKIRLNVSIANKMALEGNIAFISQSQGLATAVLDWSIEEKVGFSHFISIGSKVDVGFGDIIDYLDTDSDPDQYLKYVRSLDEANPSRMRRSALQLAKYKIWDRLGNIHQKVLIFTGSKDVMHGYEDTLNMAESLSICDLVDLETNARTHSVEMVNQMRSYLKDKNHV